MLLSLYTSYLFLCLYVCMLFMYVYVSLSDAMLLDKLNLSRTHMNSVIDQHIYQAWNPRRMNRLHRPENRLYL